MPFGKNRSQYNKNIEKNLIDFHKAIWDVSFCNNDFRILKSDKLKQGSYVYCDPPYLITCASYNEKDGWNETDERDLLKLLKELDSKGIYFGLSNRNLRDIFIYDNNGNCIHIDEHNSNEGYAIGTDNQSYLVCYQYESINSFSLDQNDNQYFTIDLLLTSNQNNNEEDNTINSTIHLAKCGLEIDSNMSFSQNSNAIDLKFIVLDSNTEENYITLE